MGDLYYNCLLKVQVVLDHKDITTHYMYVGYTCSWELNNSQNHCIFDKLFYASWSISKVHTNHNEQCVNLDRISITW